MHDPNTVAFELRKPLWKYRPWPKGVSRWEDMNPKQQRRRDRMWRQGYRESWATIWHVDTERDGTDDSCGWFIRQRHADQKVLERIAKRFEHDFDRVFRSDSGTVYFCGLFTPNGEPHFSVQGVVLNLFFLAACEHFNCNGHTNWRKARQWMQRNLFDIMLFAENPTDSLYDGLMRKFEIGCGEQYTPEARAERINNLASCIYTWILRHERPWWKHPRWHFWHWKIQITFFQNLKRFIWSRCELCGGRFKWGESPVSSQWDSDGPRWFRGERSIRHSACAHAKPAES